MKCLKRNKRPFYFASYLRKEKYGHTYRPIYGDAVKLMGNISASKGTAETEQFGINLDYDKVIVLDDPECPIEETSILFIDIEPTRNDEGDYIYDYVVKKVALSLNSVSIAIKRVDVS